MASAPTKVSPSGPGLPTAASGLPGLPAIPQHLRSPGLALPGNQRPPQLPSHPTAPLTCTVIYSTLSLSRFHVKAHR